MPSPSLHRIVQGSNRIAYKNRDGDSLELHVALEVAVRMVILLANNVAQGETYAKPGDNALQKATELHRISKSLLDLEDQPWVTRALGPSLEFLMAKVDSSGR